MTRGVPASQLQQAGVVAVHVSDAAAADAQAREQAVEGRDHGQDRQPHRHDDLQQVAVAHEGAVPERAADGQEAVVGHGGEDAVVPPRVQVHHQPLEDAGSAVDGAVLQRDASDELGEEQRGSYQVIDGQVEEQQVHGLWQASVQDDAEDHGHVAGHDEQ